MASWAVGIGCVVYFGTSILNQDVWSFAIFFLVAVPVVVSLLREENPSKALVWIVLLSVFLRSIPALGEGKTAFMIDADQMYQFQVAAIYSQQGWWTWGLETERATLYVFFPILQFASVEISAVSGLPLYQVCRFLPVFLTIPIVVLLFKICELVLHSRAALYAAFLFTVCYKYNWFDGTYVQESMALLFFMLVFYSVLSKESTLKRGRSMAFIFFLGAVLLVMTHFFTSLVIGAALFLWYIQLRLRRRFFVNSLRIEGRDALLFIVIFGLWVGLVAVATLGAGTQYVADYLSAIVDFIVSPLASRVVSQPTGIHLTILQTLVTLLGFVVVAVAGFVAIVHSVRSVKSSADFREKRTAGWILIFALIAFLLGGPSVIGQFLSSPYFSDVPSRLVTFVYFFWCPAFAVGVIVIRNRLKQLQLKRIPKIRMRRVLVGLSIAGLLLLPVASTWLLMPSYTRHETRLDDSELRAVSRWLLSSAHRNVRITGDIVMATATAALARQQRDPSLAGSLNGVLYYGEDDSKFVAILSTRTSEYVLINKAYLSHKYYAITWFYENKPLPTRDEMALSSMRINNLPMLNSIYSTSAITLYAYFHGQGNA